MLLSTNFCGADVLFALLVLGQADIGTLPAHGPSESYSKICAIAIMLPAIGMLYAPNPSVSGVEFPSASAKWTPLRCTNPKGGLLATQSVVDDILRAWIIIHGSGWHNAVGFLVALSPTFGAPRAHCSGISD